MRLKKWFLLGTLTVTLFTLAACSSDTANQTTISVTTAAEDTSSDASSETTSETVNESEAEETTAYEPYYFEDFTLYTLDGEETSLYAYEGQIILLNFWATWCPYCVDEMPLLDEIDKRDDVVVLAIDVGEDKGTVEKYINESGYAFEVFLDESGELAGTFGVTGLPMTIFMGPDFEYYYVQRGLLDQATLDAVMEAIEAL